MPIAISGLIGFVQDCSDVGTIYHTQSNSSLVSGALFILQGICADQGSCSRSVHAR